MIHRAFGSSPYFAGIRSASIGEKTLRNINAMRRNRSCTIRVEHFDYFGLPYYYETAADICQAVVALRRRRTEEIEQIIPQTHRVEANLFICGRRLPLEVEREKLCCGDRSCKPSFKRAHVKDHIDNILSAVSRPLPGTMPRCGGMARSCTDSRAAVPVLSACRGFKNNDSRGTQHRQSRTEPVHSRRLKPMIGLLPRPRRLPTAGSNRRGDMCNLTAAYLNSRTTYPSHLPGNSRIGRDILARRLSATACLCTAPSLPPSTQPLTPHPADTRSISEKARLNRRRPRLWEGCADVGRELTIDGLRRASMQRDSTRAGVISTNSAHRLGITRCDPLVGDLYSPGPFAWPGLNSAGQAEGRRRGNQQQAAVARLSEWHFSCSRYPSQAMHSRDQRKTYAFVNRLYLIQSMIERLKLFEY